MGAYISLYLVKYVPFKDDLELHTALSKALGKSQVPRYSYPGSEPDDMRVQTECFCLGKDFTLHNILRYHHEFHLRAKPWELDRADTEWLLHQCRKVVKDLEAGRGTVRAAKLHPPELFAEDEEHYGEDFKDSIELIIDGLETCLGYDCEYFAYEVH